MKNHYRLTNACIRWITQCAIILVAVVGITLSTPGTAFAKTQVHKIKTAADWKNISKYKGGSFKLTKNIRLSKTSQYLRITKNCKYTIDLNGHKVYTTYSGTQLRSVCPLTIEKGTVILKSSKKNKGVLYSTETAAVTVGGKSKFYVESGMIVNDAVEFRSNMPSGIFLTDKARCYLQGSSKVQSIGNGVSMMGSSRLYLTGHPMIRAGANNFTGMFTHYGSGINIMTPTCKLSLKGGSIGTKASPDITTTTITGTYNFVQSGDYPVYDINGKSLTTANGYKYVDARKNTVSITSSFDMFNLSPQMAAILGINTDKRLTTSVKSSDGYYTIYIVKK